MKKFAKYENSKSKKLIRSGVIVVLLILMAFKSYTQSYELRISKVIDEKGEDPGATFALVEDSVGFMWFGTVDGLFRYDGFNYKTFRNEKHNPNSLAWNTIRALCISKDNKLWIGTQGAGLDCLDLTTEKFTHYSYSENKKGGISGNDIWALTSDSKGNIWVGVVGKGVDMLDRSSNTFKHYNVLPNNEHANDIITIRSIFEDSKGIIWVGMVTYGLSSINPQTGEVVNYQHKHQDSKSLSSNDVYHVFEDSERRLIVCAFTGGVNVFDRKTNSFAIYKTNIQNANSLVSNLVVSGIEKRQNVYWIGTEYGLSIVDLNQRSFTNYKHEKDAQNSLADNRIRVVYKDKRGIVWIASEAGVDKIVEQQNFKIFKNIPDNLNSIPEGIVRSIYEDNDTNLWLGIIDKGLIKYSLKTRKITRYVHSLSNPASISGAHITSIFQDSNGKMWFGEWDSGLNSYNEQTRSFKLVAGTKNTKAKLCDTRIQFIREAKPGVLWVGTETGINRYDTRTQTCTYMVHDENNVNTLSGNSVQSNAFIQDSEGNLWLGTWSEGLNRVVFTDSLQKNAVYTHWKFDPQKPDLLNNNNVISLNLDDSLLWIGTFGGGLNCMNLRTGKFKHYTTENGLPNNIVFAILKDNEGNLWLSTDKGLSKFNFKTETFQNYSKSDGLQDDHFFWGAAFKSKSGELYFGGINGLNSFNPSLMLNNTKAPIPVLTDLKIFEKSIISDKPLTSIKALEVSYNKSYITFEFAALDYTEQSKNIYLIKMDGLDNNWHNIGNRRLASYSNLLPGDYTFRLKVANKYGIWSKSELNVQLRVRPPWWNTWLARSIFIMLIVGGFWAFYVIRVGVFKVQTRKLEDLVKIRTSEILQQKEELQIVNENLIQQKEELSETLEALKNAQHQLVESEKMASLGILTAGVAHEINNPLNFIQAGIYGIENFFEENPNCYTLCNKHSEINIMIDRMKTGVSRVSGIITSLNHFSRKTESNNQPCDIHTILDNCLLILNNQLKYNAEIKKSYTEKKVILIGNEGKLHQVFLNIIANAIQAIDENGIIELTTGVEEKMFRISIKDNGQGIKAENMSKIFDPFFTTKKVGEGTGLGLSITYGIIKEHNGSIEYISKEGKGTEAIIKLPI